jgi:hypothetical protein
LSQEFDVVLEARVLYSVYCGGSSLVTTAEGTMHDVCQEVDDSLPFPENVGWN